MSLQQAAGVNLLVVANDRRQTSAEQWNLHNALVLWHPAPVTGAGAAWPCPGDGVGDRRDRPIGGLLGAWVAFGSAWRYPAEASMPARQEEGARAMFNPSGNDRQTTGVERWLAVVMLGFFALIADALAATLVYRWFTGPAEAGMAPTPWLADLGLLALALYLTTLTVRVARSRGDAPVFGIVFRSVVGLLALGLAVRAAMLPSDPPIGALIFTAGLGVAALRSVVVLWRRGERPFRRATRTQR